ncbi:thiamine pyrophosphate-binding protein [Microbacterium elymi]|uniref:Thiamine pyrophosphate-binding protein n=1 Tax=Microbacterium elymi TaxID=2909587 RepID=A0ABY5NI01_9MICO|nr:thiamine pyrophosphate-binding protein [Microbacterium elymi]UUT34721.1 thiamine pyrophosphate-binding protein [Microbacterium elymi]
MFGIPGTHNLELYRPLAELGIRAVTTRHEQGAGYGADGWAQADGPARRGDHHVRTRELQNAMSAVGTAFCESRPLIVLSPGVARGDEFSDRGTLHETKDASAMAGAVAQWSRRVASAAEAVDAVHDAFTLFRTGRPRPVHIEIPLDVLEAPADVPAAAREARPAPAAAGGEPDAVRAAAALIAASHDPVIVAGGGATAAADAVTRLAERLGAPVLTTLNGKATVDEHHPLSLGSNLRLAAARAVAEEADVLIVLGSKLGEAELWAPALAARGAVVRVDVAAAQLRQEPHRDRGHHRRLRRGGRGAAGRTAGRREPEPEPAGAGSGAGPRGDRRRDRGVAAETVALSRVIADALPEHAIVAGDSSQIIYLGLANVLRRHRPHSLLYTPTYATLGYGYPRRSAPGSPRTTAPWPPSSATGR